MQIKVGVSNHHVHLTREDFEIIFGHDNIIKDRDLTQKNEFASTSFCIIEKEDERLEHVRVLGPFRNYSQVEFSRTDAIKFKINAPIRNSGDIKDAPLVKAKGPNGYVMLPVIIPNRHIHATKKDVDKYNLENIKIKVDGLKGGILENIEIKTSPDYVLELHLDTDDANAFMLKNGDFVEVINEKNDN